MASCRFSCCWSISLAGSLLASLLYVQFYSSRATGSQVYRAFPLLGLSITAIFVCIQFSLPLSLGLLGALSIVRFRTPIKEPEEIGFIMLVIAASIATATFKLAFVGLLFALALVALLVQTRRPRVGPESSRRHAGRHAARCRRRHQPERHHRRRPPPRRRRARLESLSRQDETLVLSYVFHNLGPEGIDRLQAELPADRRRPDVPSLPVASWLGVIGERPRRLLAPDPGARRAGGARAAGRDARACFRCCGSASRGRRSTRPSTLGVPPSELARGVSTVSLYLRPDDLHDPATGILANKPTR